MSQKSYYIVFVVILKAVTDDPGVRAEVIHSGAEDPETWHDMA